MATLHRRNDGRSPALPTTNVANAQEANSFRVVEEPTALNVTIGGKGYALDTLIVRRLGGDNLPVALITHGANPGNPRGADLGWLSYWAHDLANAAGSLSR
jgi:hypothetical protein